MVAKRFRFLAAFAALMVAWGVCGLAKAGGPCPVSGHGGVIGHGAGIHGGAILGLHTTGNLPGSAIYPSPRPTPPWIGHTYIPYQPLAPHEFLHPHYRVYRRAHAQGGWTTARVLHRSGIIGQLPILPTPAEWIGLPTPWPPR